VRLTIPKVLHGSALAESTLKNEADRLTLQRNGKLKLPGHHPNSLWAPQQGGAAGSAAP